MTEFLKALFSNNTVAEAFGIALLAVIAVLLIIITVAVLVQGREVSFWPPKISSRKMVRSPNPKKQDVDGLLGEWFEEIPASPDRRYSIATFRYEKSTGTYCYDGANYQTTGEVFCTWRSRVVIFDLNARSIYYIFDACVRGKMNASNTGFGVLNLHVDERNGLSSDSGYYIEAQEKGTPFTHTMRRLDEVAKELGIARAQGEDDRYYTRLLQAFETRRQKH